MFREGLKMIFSISDDYELVGEASNGEEALGKILSLKPDVALVDLSMPTMNGLSLVNALVDKKLPTKIIILSQHKTKDWLEKLTSNQIDGYLLKSDGRDFLISAINTVLNGDKYFSPSVAMGFYELLANKESSPSNISQRNILTPKEYEVAQYISRGFTVKEIAHAMNCSENTIKTHKTNLMRKANLKNSAEVSRWVLTN